MSAPDEEMTAPNADHVISPETEGGVRGTHPRIGRRPRRAGRRGRCA